MLSVKAKKYKKSERGKKRRLIRDGDAFFPPLAGQFMFYFLH